MTPLNSRLQLALLNRKKARNALEKGFTLVELMIVIVIVGVLSAVALPNFIGTKDKAEAGALIGSMSGLAKECSVNAIQESSQAIPGVITANDEAANAALTGNDAVDPASEGVLLTANLDTGVADNTADTNCKYGGTLSNIKAFTPDKIGGMKCGAVATLDGNDEPLPIVVPDDNTTLNTCTLTVAPDGSLSGAWSAV